jgi:hypothetical protein
LARVEGAWGAKERDVTESRWEDVNVLRGFMELVEKMVRRLSWPPVARKVPQGETATE